METKHAAREATREALVASERQQLKEYIEALDGLQQRYEKVTRAYHSLRHEKDDFLAAAADAASQEDKLKFDNTKLKEDYEHCEIQLKAAEELLQGSSAPDIVELQRLRSENASLKHEKTHLQRKVASVSQDFDFTRQQYQIVSTVAARVEELERENAGLRKKGSDDPVKLRQQSLDKTVEMHARQSTRLALENEDLKELLRRKERGRGITTRAGSVAPKSPRPGGSPGRSRTGSRAPGSRPISPVRGFLGVRRGRLPVDSIR